MKSSEAKWSNPQMLNLPPPNMRILLKCVSGPAENLRISKFRAYTGRICIFFYCIFVRFMQFPAHDHLGLDHFASQPFILGTIYFSCCVCCREVALFLEVQNVLKLYIGKPII